MRAAGGSKQQIREALKSGPMQMYIQNRQKLKIKKLSPIKKANPSYMDIMQMQTAPMASHNILSTNEMEVG